MFLSLKFESITILLLRNMSYWFNLGVNLDRRNLTRFHQKNPKSSLFGRPELEHKIISITTFHKRKIKKIRCAHFSVGLKVLNFKRLFFEIGVNFYSLK